MHDSRLQGFHKVPLQSAITVSAAYSSVTDRLSCAIFCRRTDSGKRQRAHGERRTRVHVHRTHLGHLSTSHWNGLTDSSVLTGSAAVTQLVIVSTACVLLIDLCYTR